MVAAPTMPLGWRPGTGSRSSIVPASPSSSARPMGWRSGPAATPRRRLDRRLGHVPDPGWPTGAAGVRPPGRGVASIGLPADREVEVPSGGSDRPRGRPCEHVGVRLAVAAAGATWRRRRGCGSSPTSRPARRSARRAARSGGELPGGCCPGTERTCRRTSLAVDERLQPLPAGRYRRDDRRRAGRPGVARRPARGPRSRWWSRHPERGGQPA